MERTGANKHFKHRDDKRLTLHKGVAGSDAAEAELPFCTSSSLLTTSSHHVIFWDCVDRVWVNTSCVSLWLGDCKTRLRYNTTTYLRDWWNREQIQSRDRRSNGTQL